eukprot:gene9598-12947_t
MRLDQRWLERRAQRELEQAEVERVHRLAYYDSATGLPNRSLFTEKLLKQLVDANRRDASPFGLIYAELRDFRVLLQRHGDARMNRVLKLLAERLGQELVGDDVLARLSYDGLILFVREQGERDTAAGGQPCVSLGDAVAAIEREKAAVQAEGLLPRSVETSVQGAALAFQASLSSTLLLVLAAVVTMYIVLGVLYESFIHPLTI